MLALDITDERYGRLVAIRRAPNRGRRTFWLFRCDCGDEMEIVVDNVRNGHTRSCGCLQIEFTSVRSITHGHSRGGRPSSELATYKTAIQRCHNPNSTSYSTYGARGIKVCERWRENFENFMLDMGPRPRGMTLERNDVHGDYEPGNCRWATWEDQFRNRTDNHYIEYAGRRMILSDFARLMGVNISHLHYRIKYKGRDPIEAARELQANPPKRRYSRKGGYRPPTAPLFGSKHTNVS